MRRRWTFVALWVSCCVIGCGDPSSETADDGNTEGSEGEGLGGTTSDSTGQGTTFDGDPATNTTGGDEGDTDASGDGTTTGAAPGYTPFFAMDCNDGRPGTEAVGPDALATATKVVYSDEEAIDGVGQSCRTANGAGENFFGGRYLSLDFPVGEGDDVWMRQGLFFPEGFCFGYGDTPGDGWGAVKWMRIEFDNGGPGPGDRLTLQLGNLAAQACNAQSEVFGATREYAGNANLRPSSSPPIETGRWHMVQWHVHLAADDTAFIRFWLDDEFLGQVDDVTMGASDRQIDFIQYGDYWNGSPHEDVVWYTDEVIMTVETPDTTDAQGHPYIAPTTRVDDWE
jgi:hypothetical protein